MQKVFIINGPNLGILGKRQNNIYGNKTLNDIENNLKNIATKHDIEIIHLQKNSEGEIVSILNEIFINYCDNSKSENLKRNLIGIIINPAAYTHTSIAIRDALEVFNETKVPIIEVHLSNIFSRETFRHKSYISPIATGIISGLGSYGYEAALFKIIEMGKNA